MDDQVCLLLSSALWVLAAACGGTGFFILMIFAGVGTFPPEITVIGLTLVLAAMLIHRAMPRSQVR
jgi:hypothetical protein